MIYSQICTLNWWIFRSKKGPRFRPHRNPWHRGQAILFFLIVSRGWKRLERAIGHRLPIAFSQPRTRHLGQRLPIAFSRAWKKELGLPTTENIQGRWAPHVTTISAFAQRWKKAAGPQSFDIAFSRPGKRNGPTDFRLQLDHRLPMPFPQVATGPEYATAPHREQDGPRFQVLFLLLPGPREGKLPEPRQTIGPQRSEPGKSHLWVTDFRLLFPGLEKVIWPHASDCFFPRPQKAIRHAF